MDETVSWMEKQGARRRAGYLELSGLLVRVDGAAEAVRFYKSRDATFSGWVVRSVTNPFSYSDPIPTKAEAVAALLTWDD